MVKEKTSTKMATGCSGAAGGKGGNENAATTAACGDTAGGKNAGSGKRFPFATARGIVMLAVVAVVVIGIIARIGTGVPCAIGIDQIAAICPVGALEVMLGAKDFMLHPIILLAIAVVAILLLGKAFCAWACPIPWLRKLIAPGKKSRGAAAGAESDTDPADEDSLVAVHDGVADNDAYSIAPELSEARCSTCGACEVLKKVGGKRDGVQLDSRHIVLLGTLGSAAVFGFPVFCLICPVGLTFALFIGIWNTFQFNEPSWALLIAPVILVLELTVLRKWCTKFCPISALIGLISAGNKTLKPKVDETKCLCSKGVDCHACVEACPEQLDPHSNMIPECSKCGACIEACPAHAISIKGLRLK